MILLQRSQSKMIHSSGFPMLLAQEAAVSVAIKALDRAFATDFPVIALDRQGAAALVGPRPTLSVSSACLAWPIVT